MDRRGAVIEKLETAVRHWREECGKLHSQLDAANDKLSLANTGGLPLLYDIRRALGWNDKTSLNILADGVYRVRRALQTWDTPSNMDLEALALAIKARVIELEAVNVENKNRIQELLEEKDGKP
jgi:bifunctional DNA-binding transcriptional regulator/antitoxin component of YhaV-PrlF toxin-antitoxin module